MQPASFGALALVAIGSLLLAVVGLTLAAPPVAERPAARPPAADTVSDAGVPWTSLSPAARTALAPLERDWAHLSASQKLKWVELAERLPRMSSDQQRRIQTRMAEWARMTPAERGQARLRFIQSQRTGAEDPEERWDAYQALPIEQKKQFAARAANAPATAASAQALRPGKPPRADRANGVDPTTKSNLVTNPNFGAQPQAISAATLKAGPGASTTTLSKTPTPPSHQQTGLPKIAASPGFVDKATLLPKRGPQGAAAAPMAGADAATEPVPRP